MGDVINFKKAKKKIVKIEKEKKTRDNRLTHGRSNASKDKTKKEKKISDSLLDGHKFDDPSEKSES